MKKKLIDRHTLVYYHNSQQYFDPQIAYDLFIDGEFNNEQSTPKYRRLTTVDVQ